MTPTQSFKLALKQKYYTKIVQLAVNSPNNRRFLLNFENNTFWKNVSNECFNNADFLHLFCKKVDWNVISTCKLSIAIAQRFKSFIVWPLVSKQKYLSQEFILKFGGDLLDMEIISKNYNNLSLSIQQKYAHKLNWNYVVTNHTILKEWFQKPIQDYIDYKIVSRSKHLNASFFRDSNCMEKIDLHVYMQNPNKITDALILYCLRENNVEALKLHASNVSWSDHMFVFDEYPSFVKTLQQDWRCIDKWSANNAPPLYYIKDDFLNFQILENSEYFQKLISYTLSTNVRASAAFNLMLIQNFKNFVNWPELLQQSFNFKNLTVLNREKIQFDFKTMTQLNDQKIWQIYGKYFKQTSSDCDDEKIIPLYMDVKEAYFKMKLIIPCMSQQEHDNEKTCDLIFKLNGGIDNLLNWNLLSMTQEICPFNLRHLQNVNAELYMNKNVHYCKIIYDKIIKTQMDVMNINKFI
ncbi:ac30 [Oxyplax ochracea nucleopolyhedrovirus]|uniref:Ac30 n=1 Tax=Oxyplax ochracea nucleopolyhedrovirus TaxID=2083176 RepID=A0A2L0WU79_9ABAC|nr:ac30 [Oxyplax ochracea nucleopolyhedrovirus]AVA31211.1 ac30 [Oxyplax ochracea nucleopolyhedrovirus]